MSDDKHNDETDNEIEPVEESETESEDNSELDETGIPSVAAKKRNGNKNVVAIAGICAVGLILVIWSFAGSGPAEPEPKKEDPTKNYDKKVTKLEIPKELNIPKEPPVKEKPKAEVTVTENKPPLKTQREQSPSNRQERQLSREEEQKRLARLALMEKRKKSPMVIKNSIQENQEQAAEDKQIQIARDRQQSLIESVKEIATRSTGLGSTSLTGGRGNSGGDKLGGRLSGGTGAEMVEATMIQDYTFTVGEGKVLPCVLKTAISSDLPGKISCLITSNIYGEDGKLILVPRGSEAIGEYQGGMTDGVTRIFALWTRIKTPDGVSVKIDSPGVGPLGRAGLSGEVDSHFMERFGSSMLLSVIGAEAAGEGENRSQYALGENFNRSAEIALEKNIEIESTLYKNQGEFINIFVAKDLNFKKVYQLTQEYAKR